MKFIFTFSILYFLNTVSASAQPTLTAAANMPTVGLRDMVYNSDQFVPGTPGANQTWDFSTINYSSSAAGSYEPCNAANGCSMYAGATLAYSYSGTFTYYKTNATTLSLQGFSNGGGNLYTNPEDYLRLPFTFGNSFIDTLASHYSGGSAGPLYRKGVDTVTADGWGSLKTPAGTYPNTLRIKSVSTYTDSSVFSGFPDQIRYKSYTYTWYDLAHRDFLYTTANITVTPKGGTPATISYARYTADQSLGLMPVVNAGLRCEIVPNPVRGRVQMAISRNASGQVLISLADVTGRVVRSLPTIDLNAGESKVTLPAEGLPGGIYTLRIIAGDAVMAMKVVIE